MPPSHGVSSGLFYNKRKKQRKIKEQKIDSVKFEKFAIFHLNEDECICCGCSFFFFAYPKMTACHFRMLFSSGAAETPCGGSLWSLLKSLINLFLEKEGEQGCRKLVENKDDDAPSSSWSAHI